METTKLSSFETILENKEIIELLSSTIFNPTFGKIQNIAQSIYAKTQGKFYVCKEDERVIGIMGFTRIDNQVLIVKHFAVNVNYNREAVGKLLIERALTIEGVDEIVAQISGDHLQAYHHMGFKSKKMPYDEALGERYECHLKRK